MEDLYNVLGIARQATDKEIKIAYRNLARKHHPDLNKEEGATEKFKAYQEAYDILSNVELRKAYDEQLELNDAEEFKFDITMADIMEAILKKRNNGHTPTKGKSFVFDLPVHITDILRSNTIEHSISFTHLCATCVGSGNIPSNRPCNTCDGEGGVMQTIKTPFGTLRQRVGCSECHGTGKVVALKCPSCEGEKTVVVSKTVSAKLEKTAKFGDVVIVEREGAPGFFGGTAGDIRFTLIQSSDDEMKVIYDKDVENFVYVSVEDALLGNTITLEMPDGTCRNVVLSEHFQNPRNQMIFPNEGMYHNGNRGIYSARIVVDFSAIEEKVKSSLIEGIRRVIT